MKTILTTLSIIGIFFISSCKKNNTAPDPVAPVPPKPDTLSTGWKKVMLDSTNYFGDIFFANNTTGYLLGSKAYKTTDGGLTWNAILNSGFANIAVTNDGKVFFVGGGGGDIYKSTDAGNTFIKTNVSGSTQGFDVFFVDNNNGFFTTGTGLYKTTDAGVTWVLQNTVGAAFGGGYTTLFFTTANTGFMVGNGGVYKTNGSLLNWNAPVAFTPTVSSTSFFSVFVTPNNNIYTLNHVGQLYKSTDNGATFSQISAFAIAAGYCDVHFVDNNTGYVCAGNRIYKTTDAGATWNVVVALGASQLVELHFTDAAHGWACGSNGTVLVFN